MIYLFDDYALNTQLYELRHAGTLCRLEPQVLDILLYLIQYRDRVVTRRELLEHVWPDRFITETTLDHRLMQARQAIGDSGQTQRCIKTLRGRGYRFVAAVEERLEAVCHARRDTALQQGRDMVCRHDGCWSTPRADSTSQTLPPTAGHGVPAAVGTPAVLVGRNAELTQLRQLYTAALQGVRQVAFVTGEAGIGKTALVDAFVAQVVATESGWVGRGQCIEQHSAGEAYLPLLEAFGQLARTPDGLRLVAILRQHAPSWLLQMPALVPTAEFDALQQQTSGTTRERMLRELAEAVESLTAEQPLVLVLEDLHWSDSATLDWLVYMARRRAAARLLVLATYRPGEALVHVHPVPTVTQELKMHGQCTELGLAYFSEREVATYLAQRFARAALPEGLARVLHRRTNGNPLFLATMLDDLMQQEVLRHGETGWGLPGGIATVAAGVPESLRQLLARHLEQLPPEEQALLEAASVVGVEFAVAAVAAAINWTVTEVEERCAALARRGQFVQVCGTDAWPDGTIASRYGFLHALYRDLLYERVPAGRRVRWHQQIGRRLEAGYDPQAREQAAERAEHFVCGRDTGQAVKYLHYAGEQAGQRSAHREALQHLPQGLVLPGTLPQTTARVQQEIDLQLALGHTSGSRRAAPSGVDLVRPRIRSGRAQRSGRAGAGRTRWSLFPGHRQRDAALAGSAGRCHHAPPGGHAAPQRIGTTYWPQDVQQAPDNIPPAIASAAAAAPEAQQSGGPMVGRE